MSTGIHLIKITTALTAAAYCLFLSACSGTDEKESDTYVISISAAEAAEAKKETNGKQVLLTLMNESRKKKGRKPLTLNPRLTRAAQLHSEDMNRRGVMSHTGSDGGNFVKRMQRQGYRLCYSSENLANAPSALWVNRMWVVSEKHKKNLFGKKYTHVGIGRSGRYWTAVYAEEMYELVGTH